MSALANVEAKLNNVFVKNAPFQIPENGRKWLATYAWVFALIGLVLGVFGALALFAILGGASVAVNTAYVGTGVQVVEAKHYLVLAWLALAVLVGYLVVLGMSIPKLRAMRKSGWDLSFYSLLFFAGYDVFNWLQYPSTGLFNLIVNLLGVAVGLYVLFQVRSYFTK